MVTFGKLLKILNCAHYSFFFFFGLPCGMDLSSPRRDQTSALWSGSVVS